MQALKHLALDGNSLARLAPELGQLSRLEQLLLQALPAYSTSLYHLC
jgi:Leucine-rich repeat (LRR) protein